MWTVHCSCSGHQWWGWKAESRLQEHLLWTVRDAPAQMCGWGPCEGGSLLAKQNPVESRSLQKTGITENWSKIEHESKECVEGSDTYSNSICRCQPSQVADLTFVHIAASRTSWCDSPSLPSDHLSVKPTCPQTPAWCIEPSFNI